MALEKGGMEGEFLGRVYPCVVGLRHGERLTHMFGEGTTYEWVGNKLLVMEPNGGGGTNTAEYPVDNVAYVCAPFFMVEKQRSE